MSTNCPAVSNMPSMSRRFRPLSMTWVRPSERGLPGRCGRSRNPSLKAGIELLQLLVGGGLHVVVERVPVGVDADGERPEVLDAGLPQALGHQLRPGALLDLLDLRRLERGGAADDREIDHPVAAHRLDRLVREAPFAADRPYAVLLPERLREPDHAGACRRADADRVVAAVLALADAGRRVEQERAAEAHPPLDALVENADLRAVADTDDVALDDDLVAGAELEDLALVRDREGDLVNGHRQCGLVRGLTPVEPGAATPRAQHRPTMRPMSGSASSGV